MFQFFYLLKSGQSLVENDIVGVIIENNHIYQMHKSMWNMLWDLVENEARSKFYPKGYKGG